MIFSYTAIKEYRQLQAAALTTFSRVFAVVKKYKLIAYSMKWHLRLWIRTLDIAVLLSHCCHHQYHHYYMLVASNAQKRKLTPKSEGGRHSYFYSHAPFHSFPSFPLLRFPFTSFLLHHFLIIRLSSSAKPTRGIGERITLPIRCGRTPAKIKFGAF